MNAKLGHMRQTISRKDFWFLLTADPTELETRESEVLQNFQVQHIVEEELLYACMLVPLMPENGTC